MTNISYKMGSYLFTIYADELIGMDIDHAKAYVQSKYVFYTPQNRVIVSRILAANSSEDIGIRDRIADRLWVKTTKDGIITEIGCMG